MKQEARNGSFQYNNKIYKWVYDMANEYLIVKYQNEELYRERCDLVASRLKATSNYMNAQIKKWVDNPPIKGYHIVDDE